MQENVNILNELKDVGAAALLQAGNKNPYFVPENYFESLAPQVLAHIFLKSLPSGTPYTVPSAYFENLPGIIIEKINLYKEVHIPAREEKHLYSVPEGFFENFADTVLQKIKKSESNTVQEELEEISPLLSKLPRSNVYTVPVSYFDEIDALAAVGEGNKPAAKVISLGSKTRRWINYAAAACIAAILFCGGYIYTTNLKTGDSEVASLKTQDVQREMSNLSDEEIQNYLKTNSNIAVYTSAGLDDETKQQNLDIQNLLENVSDEEIQQYLNQQDDATDTREGI